MRIQSARILSTGIFLAAIFAGMYGCKKSNALVIAPSEAFFATGQSGNYQISTPGVTYKIPIGITNVSQTDRTVNITVSSPTGAEEGTHYSVDHSLVIPAGQALDSLVVSGVYDEYSTGRKDVLEFSIVGDATLPAASFNNTFKLSVSGPCFDADISDINVISGDFTQTFENGGAYGPYIVTISNITSTGPTTGTATISNLYDFFGPVNIDFDWTDPDNITVSIPLQETDQDYDVGQPFYIRTSPGKINTFSVCNQRVTLTVDIVVGNYPGPGQFAYYEQEFSIIMDR